MDNSNETNKPTRNNIDPTLLFQNSQEVNKEALEEQKEVKDNLETSNIDSFADELDEEMDEELPEEDESLVEEKVEDSDDEEKMENSKEEGKDDTLKVDEFSKNIIPLDPKEFPMINNYCENLTTKSYVTNPAIQRDEEIKKAMLILLTPDKSALLIGKAGIGKTAIVEGIAYRIQNNDVPNALKGYQIFKINSSSMLGTMVIDGKEESVTNLIVDELKRAPKTILFIDEIHTLIGGSQDGPMDLANILKPALDRGDIKAIGATTTIEYETYIVRDRAFLRRFDRVDVAEPDFEATVQILLGTIPKIEHQTGIKMYDNSYLAKLLVESIVSATSEFKRVYGLSAMYPDVSLSVLSAAFSNALFENRDMVGIEDVYMAIRNSKRIYPDSRVKECNTFREKFKRICEDMHIELPVVQLEDIDTGDDL